MSAKAWTRSAATVMLVTGLVGCAAGCSTKERTPLVVPIPTFTPSGTGKPTTPPARIVGVLPTGCDAIATTEEVADAVGQAVSGSAKLVKGSADPAIGRTARIDCYYGLTEGQKTDDAPIQVGLASYSEASSASTRVTKTVDEERKAGATVSEVQVGPDKGSLLVGRKIVTLVATHQATTVVVVAKLELVPANQAPSMLTKIADRALSPR